MMTVKCRTLLMALTCRAPRRSPSVAGLLLLALVLAACDPKTPAPFAPEPCLIPSALVEVVQPQSFTPTALRPALLHAAGPMTSALGTGASADTLRRVLGDLGQSFAGNNFDTECRLVVIAWDALSELPDTPETLPDRDGIRLILALAARALEAAALAT